MPTANELIVQFIKKQPESLRDSIAAGFAMMEASEMPETSAQLHEMAYAWIDRGSWAAKAMWAAAAIGVLDLYFAKTPISPETLQYHAELKDSDALRDVARKSELRNMYFERAAAEWQSLRTSTLTISALVFAP